MIVQLVMSRCQLIEEKTGKNAKENRAGVAQTKSNEPDDMPPQKKALLVGPGSKLRPIDVAGLLATLPLPERGTLLRQLDGKSLSRADIHQFALNFSTLSDDARQSMDMAEYLALVFEVTQKRGLLDPEMARYFGRLFAGDSFAPEGNGFGKNSRTYFETCRSMANQEQKQGLDCGLKQCLENQITSTPICSPRESVQKLVRAMTNWGDERYAKSADCFFGPKYVSSWNLAIKHLGVLFLLKAREVSPEANSLSEQMVGDWLRKLADGKTLTSIRPIQLNTEDEPILSSVLIEIGNPDILNQMAERAQRPENRHAIGVINSPPIIYCHQFRNLILKEIRRGFPLNEMQRVVLETELNKNETELTDMLRQFQAEEGTTDGLSGYNTYAVATTVLTSRDPSSALTAMRAASDQEYAPYYIDSAFKSSPRSGAGRTVPFRLVEVAYGRTPEEIRTAREKLAKAAITYMDCLPDLMYHARGRYWHRGDDRIAPYFFHPTVPYEASALRMLANDPRFTEMERTHFKYLKDRLRRAIIASQKVNGTFMLPDTAGDPTEKKEENGGYYSSPAWVNPLAGLALLCLIDDAQELHTQFGILNPEMFEKE
ncbi:MAG: hypothetical protein NTZ32_00185 [Planctomycetales bacterium]|nr:hypothetical protein [Planctomycetales bacterium]